MGWNRTNRQEAILREKIAVIVLDRLNDPRVGFVTITAVELSKDKRRCTVTYTCMGTDSERRTTARALKNAAPRIQEQLAPTLQSRLIPEIVFAFDEGVEKERHMRVLLDKLAAERDEEEAERAEEEGDGLVEGDEDPVPPGSPEV